MQENLSYLVVQSLGIRVGDLKDGVTRSIFERAKTKKAYRFTIKNKKNVLINWHPTRIIYFKNHRLVFETSSFRFNRLDLVMLRCWCDKLL